MKETYHICLASHSEVMYRSEEDFIIGFNYLALSSLETDSILLADGFLSTHHHSAVRTNDPETLAKRNRFAYTRYFNAKYHRKGSLGERGYFVLKVEGLYHTQAMLNYVIRQGLHHGLAATPFGYKHCSANAIYMKELGKDCTPQLIDDRKRHLYLPFNTKAPEKYRMSKDGLLLREDVEDTAYVEGVYVSPRNYMFQMNRYSDGKDIAEQEKENSSPAVTISDVERGVPGFDPSKVLVAEQGRVNRSRMTDIELCHIIDDIILPARYLNGSRGCTIYQLPDRKRQELGSAIWSEAQAVRYRKCDSLFSERIITEDQLRRCLCI